MLGLSQPVVSILALFMILGSVPLPRQVKDFRDEARFWQRLLGLRTDIRLENSQDIESVLRDFAVGSRAYLREELTGFLCERAGDLETAKRHYENCLNTKVYEGENFYCNLDLARVDLKQERLADAARHLATYIAGIEAEIRASEGELVTDYSFATVISKDDLPRMKEHLKQIQGVLNALREFLSKQQEAPR